MPKIENEDDDEYEDEARPSQAKQRSTVPTVFSETLPAHFRYYLVTTDAAGHWAAKKIQKIVN